MWENETDILADGKVLVSCGPMRMVIEASRDGVQQPHACLKAAREAIAFLEQVAADMAYLKLPAVNSPVPLGGPLAVRMWHAVRKVGDPDLTPMAAVAGVIADATAAVLEDQGMTRVIVNNGGDVALRLKGEERLVVGIRPDVDSPDISHRVVLTPGMNIRGVATSGLGGRSFTRGIASAATVFSHDAVWADAAATALANATYIPSALVVRKPAQTIYADTDLEGLDVTVWVGELSPRDIDRALSQGLTRAEELASSGTIFGACLFVKGGMVATEKLVRHMEALK